MDDDDEDPFVDISITRIDDLLRRGLSDDQVAVTIALSIMAIDTDPIQLLTEIKREPRGRTAYEYNRLCEAALLAVDATRRRN